MALALIWTVIVAAIVAPLVFRDRWWLRVLSVVVMVWFAGVAWTGVVGSSRLASETAHRDGIEVSKDFLRGSIAARDAATSMMPLFLGIVVGLSLLALVPSRVKK